MENVYVIGADSQIGKNFLLKCKGIKRIIFSSKRGQIEGSIPLELGLDLPEISSNENPGVIYFFSGITNISHCENNKNLSFNVNCTSTLKLIRKFVDLGNFVVWLSSGAVFSGNTAFPNERDFRDPVCEYGKQKKYVEDCILADAILCRSVAIVRPTKVLFKESGLIAEFINRMKNGESVHAFRDLRINPVSVDYLCDGIIKIGNNCLPGIYQFSGQNDYSYETFLLKIAKETGINSDKIIGINSSDLNIALEYSPRYPGLGMRDTFSSLQISPESIESILRLYTN